MLLVGWMTGSQPTLAQCDYAPNTSFTLVSTGGNTTAEYTNRYILTDAAGVIVQVQNTPAYSGITAGHYIAYNVNYQTASGINNLAIGQSVVAIGGSCAKVSAPLVVNICTGSLPCDFDSSSPISFVATGGNTTTGYTNQYALTDMTGQILALSTTTSFPAQEAGTYILYNINYETTSGVSGLSVGNTITQISGICATVSAPLVINVCATAPPLTTSDIATTGPNTPVTGNVLTNDSDPQGLPLTAGLLSPPATGTAVLTSDGAYAYTPPVSFTGTVTFCYSVSNTVGLSGSACVTVNVVPEPVRANNRPVASNDNTQTLQNTPVIIVVNANDTDPDAVTNVNGQLGSPIILSQPAQGTAGVNDNGTVTYTPPAGFTGTVSFSYRVCDGATPSLCATALVTVQVDPTPPANTTLAPVAVDDVLLTSANTPNTGNAATNDYDPNTPPLGLTYVGGQPTSGTVVMNTNGAYTYTPPVGFSGPTSFTYSVCNTAARCDPATVSVLVQPVPGLVSLLPKVYLQGALFGVLLPDLLMRDDLRAKGILPLAHPYGALNPRTTTPPMAPSVTALTGTNAIVDWVFVELRAANATTVVDSRAALLQRDGDIVDVDGMAPLTFGQALPGSYFVVVRHRNHLGVMSQTALPLSATTTTVDFRNPDTPTFTPTGTTSYTQITIDQAQVVVEQGVAMWAGNSLNDNATMPPRNLVIYQGTNNDVNLIYQQMITAPNNVLTSPFFKLRGYVTGDVNLNGETIFQGTGNDVEFIYQNIVKNHPGNVLKVPFFTIREQLP